MRVGTAIAVLGFVVVAIGSLGPWVTTVLGSADGLRGDGKITIALAGLAVVAMAVGRGDKAGGIFAGVAAVAALGVAGYDLIHIQHETTGATLFGHRLADAGWGVYAAVVGAAAAIVALASFTPRPLREMISALAIVGAVGVIAVGASQSNAGATQSASSPIPTIPTDATSTPTVPTDTSAAAPASPSTPTSPSSPASPSAGAAPVVGTGPPAGSAATKCDPNIYAGPNTSCGFAENVFKAVAAGYRQGGEIPASVSAFSSATHRTYRLQCQIDSANDVECANSLGGLATFSVHSVQVY